MTARMLCLVPDQDTPGKLDVTGAFLPEARAFAKLHGALPDRAIRTFPTVATLQKRRNVCLQHFGEAEKPLSIIAFFCHGYRDGIQAGFNRGTVLTLARLIAQHATSGAHVLLYACQTGRDVDGETSDDTEPGPGGDGGFADELRDACEALGRQITVMGHTTSGHCTVNPFARAFVPDCGGRGGHWYVEPESELWQTWRRTLRDPRSTLRLRFPLLSPAELRAELEDSGPPLVA